MDLPPTTKFVNCFVDALFVFYINFSFLYLHSIEFHQCFLNFPLAQAAVPNSSSLCIHFSFIKLSFIPSTFFRSTYSFVCWRHVILTTFFETSCCCYFCSITYFIFPHSVNYKAFVLIEKMNEYSGLYAIRILTENKYMCVLDLSY